MEIQIRDITIGKGKPKICVPLCGDDFQEVCSEINELSHITYDLVEWRIDFYQQDKILQDVYKIREKLGNTPLLLTFRTLTEGGNRAISEKEYCDLYKQLLDTDCVDLIDVEAYREKNCVTQLIEYAHKNGKSVILSYHDFEKTPSCEEIVQRLSFMHGLQGDICKIAVMPNTLKDVLILLDATRIASESLSCPLVTMSMSKLGLISRLAGEVFGSCITFGCSKNASAPGQIESVELNEVLKVIHKNYK